MTAHFAPVLTRLAASADCETQVYTPEDVGCIGWFEFDRAGGVPFHARMLGLMTTEGEHITPDAAVDRWGLPWVMGQEAAALDAAQGDGE